MADTIPDVRLTNSAYVDLYAASKIEKGKDLIIQNKTATGVYIQIRTTQPAVASRDGYLLMSNEVCVVSSVLTSGVWAFGSGAIFVQIFE